MGCISGLGLNFASVCIILLTILLFYYFLIKLASIFSKYYGLIFR